MAKQKKESSKPAKEKKEKKARVVKRKAKRVEPKKQNSYHIIQSAISNYCKEKYGKSCSKKEMSEIYQALKSRYKDSKGVQINPNEIAKEIDKRLAYYDVTKVPKVLKDFLWFDVVDRLKGNDGLYFRDEDMIVLDFSSVSDDLGVMKTPYSSLEEFYTDDLYPLVQEYFEDVYNQTGIKVSPPPTFVLNEEQTDYEKRIFRYEFDIDDKQKSKEKLEQREEGFDLTDKDVKDAIEQAKEEKLEQSQEKEPRVKSKDEIELELTQAKIKLNETNKSLIKERKELISMYRDMLDKKEISQDMFTQLLQDLMK
jgi:hypothetical protein